eukprot:scaffold96791_cov22-Tisochrysis_lutea.AAC.1
MNQENVEGPEAFVPYGADLWLHEMNNMYGNVLVWSHTLSCLPKEALHDWFGQPVMATTHLKQSVLWNSTT